MKMPRLIVIAILLCSPLGAEDKTYEKILNYESVIVKKVDRDRIRIMHKSGFATIPIEELPENVRNDLGMSLEGVEEYRKLAATMQAEQARKAAVASANKKILADAWMRIEYAKVFQIVDGGALVEVGITWNGTYKEVPQYETRSYRIGNALSGYRVQQIRAFIGNKKVKDTEFHDDWLIFVRCNSADIVDGEFSGDVWAAGTFYYKNIIGGIKAVKKYTTNPKEVLENTKQQ